MVNRDCAMLPEAFPAFISQTGTAATELKLAVINLNFNYAASRNPKTNITKLTEILPLIVHCGAGAVIFPRPDTPEPVICLGLVGALHALLLAAEAEGCAGPAGSPALRQTS